jgi:iron complex outermembrane recepter protein
MMFQFHPIARLSRIIPPLLFVLLNIFSDAVIAGDKTQKQQYNIPPQPLAAALQAFSDSSHLQLLYDANLVAGLTSPAVKGAYTPGQALAQLLGRSGLDYQIKNAHMVTLTKRTVKDSGVNADENLLPVVQVTAKANENAGSDTTLPKVTVEADANNPYDDPTWQTDPYNTDYVLPKATAGTKTNTPVMETPLNVQVISKQVLKDQQVIRLDQALKNVSGVTTHTG